VLFAFLLSFLTFVFLPLCITIFVSVKEIKVKKNSRRDKKYMTRNMIVNNCTQRQKHNQERGNNERIVDEA